MAAIQLPHSNVLSSTFFDTSVKTQSSQFVCLQMPSKAGYPSVLCGRGDKRTAKGKRFRHSHGNNMMDRGGIAKRPSVCLPLTASFITNHTTDEVKTDYHRCECYNFHKYLVPYRKAWKWQKSVVRDHVQAVERGDNFLDCVAILQHLPVYTMGAGSSEKFLLFDQKNPPFELFHTERGGEVTYHGPGQLVMYPILNLRNHKMDIHWYLRSLEEVVIRALLSACDLEASRIPGLTGVWVDEKKVAAIGVRMSRWITYHGLALNVTTDLMPFDNIIPCGIADYPVATISEVLKQRGSKPSSILLDTLHESLLEAFSEVFNVELVQPQLHPGSSILEQITSFGTQKFL